MTGVQTCALPIEDESIANGLNMFIVADNIRKGAALNAVQIAEALLERNLLRVP